MNTNLIYCPHTKKEGDPMSKPPPLRRTEYLYHIERDFHSLTRWAETQPDIFAKVVTDKELEQLEAMVNNLVAQFEMTMKKSDT